MRIYQFKAAGNSPKILTPQPNFRKFLMEFCFPPIDFRLYIFKTKFNGLFRNSPIQLEYNQVQ